MKVVVCGVMGMAGHVVAARLREKHAVGVVGLARRRSGLPVLDAALRLMDLTDTPALSDYLCRERPCVVVNCAAGHSSSRFGDLGTLEAINTRLPHAIAAILDRVDDGSRLIQVSTDGVFKGDRGHYVETDPPDAADLYALSKIGGEVTHAPHLTIRTSIVGPSLSGSHGLFDWFMDQDTPVRGFTKAIWSGVTTVELARFVDFAVAHRIDGLCHLASGPISKSDLLNAMRTVFDHRVPVRPDPSVVVDRSLATVRSDTGYLVPTVERMLLDLRDWIDGHRAFYPHLHELRSRS